MKKLIKYCFIFFVLFFSTSIDEPKINNKITVSDEIKGTPKLVEEIRKLDELEIRIDKLISGKLDK